MLNTENTSWGRSVTAFDKVADIEDSDKDIDIFTRFMRATKAPARRHRGEAGAGVNRYNTLTERQRGQLVRFLRSL